MEIGRRLYYDNRNGSIILEVGERIDNRASTVDEDFEAYQQLAERVRSTVGVLEMEFGEYREEFRSMQLDRVNPETETPIFLDGEEPVEIPPTETLQARVNDLEDENALITMELALTQMRLDSAEQEQASLLLSLVEGGVL